MSTQQDHDEEDCLLCGGTGEVSISKDGTYEGTDYYGCPMCISRERDEEVRLIKAQRDELLKALQAFIDAGYDRETAITAIAKATGKTTSQFERHQAQRFAHARSLAERFKDTTWVRYR